MASIHFKDHSARFFGGSLMKQSSVWVGVLDLDYPGGVTGVNGPLRASHQEVSLLVRMHQAPIGYVRIPVRPQASLTERARVAAEADLAQAVQLHKRSDGEHDLETAARWASLAACPRHFPSSGPGITVVVCTRDRTEKLRDCLSAMRRFSYEPLEILVVDNAPTTEATRDLVATLASTDLHIRYSCEPMPGLSRARNHGLGQARYDIVAFTDDDTLADPGWPIALAAGFASDAQTVCVTGLVVASALETSSEQYFAARYARSQALEPQQYDLSCHPSRLYPYAAGIFGTGANFAVRRDVILRLGGFDPLLGAGSQGRGGEDLDMFLRVILAGGTITYLPSALVWHRHRTSAEDLREQIYSYGHGLGAYLAKHRRNRGLQAALLAHGLGQVGRTILGLFRAALRSRLGMGATRYAFTEMKGFVAGAWSYWTAAS
jgi:GT2 family glycosyltransferase